MTRPRRKNKPERPRRERELHAKTQISNLLDSDTRSKLKDLKKQLTKGDK